MTLRLLPEFLTPNEVQSLLKEFDRESYVVENTKYVHDELLLINRHKNIHYNRPVSIARRIIYPKLKKLLGEHVMDNGSFLESHYPYSIHVDTHSTFEKQQFYSHTQHCTNISLIISLNDDPGFKTVFFDYFSNVLDYNNPPTGNNDITTDPKYKDIDLSHLTNQEHTFIKNLSITNVYQWKAGHAVMWPRDQLHSSSNFYSSGLQKKAVVMFF